MNDVKFFQCARKYLIAVLIAIAICCAVASAAEAIGFIILVKHSPPPDDPNGWVIVIPADTPAQPILAAGYHPVGMGTTAGEADAEALGWVSQQFPSFCRKAWSVWRNEQTGETIVQEDFAQPHAFGFALQQGGLCLWEARVIIGQPPFTFTNSAGTVSLTRPGPTFTPPPPPPPPPAPRPAPPAPQTPPNVQVPPSGTGNPPTSSGTGSESNPIPDDEDGLPVPQPIPNESTIEDWPEDNEPGETTVENWPEDNEPGETTVENWPDDDEPESTTAENWPEDEDEPEQPTTETQAPPPVQEQRPPATKYPDMAGTWRRSRWTDYATLTISQSGNRIQWTQDYPWGGGMRHEVANGVVTEIGTGLANCAIDVDYDEADGSHSKASYTGEVTYDGNGKAIKIEWSNGADFERPQ